ncbi:MAG: type VI secretion system tip protein VgrG [Myxococcales bacterium]|nr:type VI secretion system tip protein VgrG [Myxococcales bacterium]
MSQSQDQFLRASRFVLSIEKEEDRDLYIDSFEVRHALMAHSQAEVAVVRRSAKLLHIGDFLGKAISLVNQSWSGEATVFEGFVTEVEQSVGRGGLGSFQLVCMGPSYCLEQSAHVRSFRKMTVRDIVTSILKEHNLEMKISGKAENTVEVVAHQVLEDDFQFLLRLLDENELALVTHEKELRIIDRFDGDDMKFGFGPMSGLVEASIRASARTLGFEGMFHDVAQNATTKIGSQVDGDVGSLGAKEYLKKATDQSKKLFSKSHRFHHFQRAKTAKQRTELLKRESRRATRWLVHGHGITIDPALRPSSVVELPLDSSTPQKFGVTATRHVYDGNTFETHFEFTAADRFDREKPVARRMQEGIITGRVVQNHDPQGLGRVQVEFRWGEVSDWLRVVMPHAGRERGFQFLPEVDDEVVVAFVDGDVEQGMVIGSVWNGRNKQPGEPAEENPVKIIRTRSGLQMRFSDEEGKETIEISTPEQKCLLKLTHDDKPKITLAAEADIQLESKDGNIQLIATNGEVGVDCKALKVRASDGVEITAGKIEAKSDADVKIDAGANVQIKGTSDVKISGLNVSLKGDVSLKAEGTMAEVKANANMVIKGMPVMIN